MASSRDRDAWSHIFKLYKGLPHLWDRNNKCYGNRSMMTDGYKILTRVYIDKLDRQATVDTLRMKMKNLRTTYYRELRKVRVAKQKGRNYTPTLWYFENMNFLSKSQSSECIADAVENKSIEDPVQIKELRQEEHTRLLSERCNIETNPSVSTSYLKATKRTIHHYKNRPSFLLEEQNNHIIGSNQKNSIKDEHWEIIGKSIGYQLRELNTKQFTVVSKLISDAIFFGRLNKLSEASHIEIGPPAYTDSASANNIYSLSGHYSSGLYESDVSLNREHNTSIIVKDEEYINHED